MPELPDVAGLKSILDSTSLHKKIEHTSVLDDRILRDVTPQVLGRKLKDAELEESVRHGKYLFARASTGGWLLLHFGMSGELHMCEEGEDLPKHTRVVFDFEDGSRLAYISQRMLGEVGFIDDLEAFTEREELGCDALDPDLTMDRFLDMLQGKRGAIKSTLMNQSLIAGIGNVYSDEILFQAGVLPMHKVNELDEKTLRKIHRVMRRVLKVAADRHGVIERLPGKYFLPHRDKDGECPSCGKPLSHESVSGRTAIYCANCQN